MSRIGTLGLAWVVAVAASGLLVLDLFLDWSRTTVEVAGIVTTEASVSGWSGWGAVAGVLAVVLAVLGIVSLRRPHALRRHLVAWGLVPLGLLGATVVATFSGDVTIDVAQTVGVTVESDLWPTWVGLALGLVASLAGLVAILGEAAAEDAQPARPAAHLP